MTESEIAEWAEAYPGVDVHQQLRAMRQWCLNNPAQCKTASGIGRFITAWLAKDQNRGRSFAQERPTAVKAPTETMIIEESQDEADAAFRKQLLELGQQDENRRMLLGGQTR